MSYRGPPDGRFSRDRPPPQSDFPGLHPSRSAFLTQETDNPPSPSNNQFAPNTTRGSGQFGGPHRGGSFNGPPAPRGRGFSPRGDFRGGYRDREPVRTPHDPSPAKRPWEDFNRANDPRSPPLTQPEQYDFRDAGPREFDGGRGRRGYRDGPGRFADSRPAPPHLQNRESFNRGRGRFDSSPAGRGRGAYPEERGGTFRGRSRSPRNYRWERDPQRDAPRELIGDLPRVSPKETPHETSRDFNAGPSRRQSGDDRIPDRYEGVHPSRRPSEIDRVSRDRDERAREAETYRRDQLNSPAAFRSSNNSVPHTPRSYGAPSPAFNASGAGSHQFQDRPDGRQPTQNGLAGADRDFNKNAAKPLRPPSRDESSIKQPAAPRSSPPPAPEVPAFGSIPTASNVWRSQPPSGPKAQTQQAPVDPQPDASREAPRPQPEAYRDPPRPHPEASRDPPKPQPPAADIDIGSIAPKAPKALQSTQAPMPRTSTGAYTRNAQQPPRPLARSQINVAPTPVASMTRPNASRLPQPAPAPQMPPVAPRQMTAPSGPKPAIKSESMSLWLSNAPVGPDMKQGSRASPSVPFATPAGPRASNVPSNDTTSTSAPANTIPSGPAVPLGPKAERFSQAQSFRVPPGRPTLSMNNRQVQRPDPNPTPFRRPGAIPAKREASGTVVGEQAATSKPALNGNESPAPDQQLGPTASAEHNQHKRQKVEDSMDIDEEPNGTTATRPEDQQHTKETTKRRNLDLSDDEDAMDFALDPAEIAQHEEQFERDKARLEAQKIDLSTRHLRGCTPIEQLSLLSRLALQNFSELFPTHRKKSQAPESVEIEEAPVEPEPEVEEPMILPVEREKPALSPSPIGTPELRDLPFLVLEPLTPISDQEFFQENLKRQELAFRSLNMELQRMSDTRLVEEEHLRDEYETKYRTWRYHVKELERQKQQEEAANAATHESATENVAETSPLAQPTPEIRRRGGTEYDFQKAMEESLKLAQEQAQEEAKRNALPMKPDYEREAMVPELNLENESKPIFRDATCLRDPRDAVTFYELKPPDDDFTKQEHEVVVQNWREFPKKFGRIAQGLPGRTYKDCINHYYATKWNGQYKPVRDKRKGKTPKSTKGKLSAAGTMVRPRASALISNLDDAKPDLYDGEEAAAPIMAVTESGRPKRAAAPNFKEKEPVEATPAATPAKRGGKGDGLEGQVEKSARKAKGPPRERQKKAKAPLALRPPSTQPRSLSPAPPPIERQVIDTRMEIDPREFESANVLAQLATGTMLMAPPRPEEQISNPPDGLNYDMSSSDASRTDPSRTGAAVTSSYWSVHEVNQFPALLQHYGTDWSSISNAMGTKSQVMVSTPSGQESALHEPAQYIMVDPSPQVKNYYSRMKNGPQRAEFEGMANEANARRERGEITGPPPAPPAVFPVRRRNDRVQVSGPRALAPSGEIIEVEDDGPMDVVQVSQAPSIPSNVTNYPPLMGRPGSHHGRSASGHAPSQTSNPATGSHPHYPQSIHMPAEVQDVFVRGSGPPENQYIRAMDRQPQMAPPDDSRRIRYDELRNPSSTGPLIQPWERVTREEARPAMRFQPPPVASNTENRSPDKQRRYVEGPLFGAPSRPQIVERSASDSVARVGARDLSTQSQANSRPLLDHSTLSRPASTTFFDPTRDAPFTDEPVRTTARPPNSFKDIIAPEQPRSVPPPKSEPRKMSNLADILNADPDERKPTRNFTTPAPSYRTQTPPQYGPVGQPAYQPMFGPPSRPPSQPNRAETISETSRPVPPGYHAPLFMQPPTSVRAVAEPKPREAPLQAGAFRIDWPPGQATYQPQPAERVSEVASPFERRASLKSLDVPRYGPSPTSAVVREQPSDPSNYRSFASYQSLNTRANPSPPPVRPYSYAPPTHAHSREASSSRVPVTQAQMNVQHQPQPSMSQPHQHPHQHSQPLHHHQHHNSGSVSSIGSYAETHRQPQLQPQPPPPSQHQHPIQSQHQQSISSAPPGAPLLQPLTHSHSLFAKPQSHLHQQQQPSGPHNPYAASNPNSIVNSTRPPISSNLHAVAHNQNAIATSPTGSLHERDRIGAIQTTDWTQGIHFASPIERTQSAQRTERDRDLDRERAREQRHPKREYVEQWQHQHQHERERDQYQQGDRDRDREAHNTYYTPHDERATFVDQKQNQRGFVDERRLSGEENQERIEARAREWERVQEQAEAERARRERFEGLEGRREGRDEERDGVRRFAPVGYGPVGGGLLAAADV